MVRLRIVSFSLIIVMFMAATLQGQLNRGAITGSVVDATGSMIPNAKIQIRNPDTGASYDTLSNAAGQYTAPNLPAGPYQITFEAPGMKTFVRTRVNLGATEVLRVDATLEVGLMAEHIEVAADVSKLQTDTPEVGTSLSNRELVDLPLSFSGFPQHRGLRLQNLSRRFGKRLD